jgi:molybdate transport system ATP-binding protein
MDDIVDMLGIGHLLARWPSDLSGGEMQRVAIGRALLTEPQCLLFDEPLSSLDSARKVGIQDAIDRICKEMAIPILYVTHDLAEAERLSAHIIVMKDEAALPT